MYDETIDVLNAKEVKSPESSEEDIISDMKMNKFNTPDPATINKFDSSDSSSDVERNSKQVLPERQSGSMSRGRRTNLKATSNINALSKQLKISDSSENSETDSNDQDNVRGAIRPGGARPNAGGLVIPPESAYDPKKYQDLKVSPELENLFQHILRYTPQKIDIEYKLMPFIPDYIPAVGDIDAFIKITTPSCAMKGEPISNSLSENISSLGLTVLDEPAAEQSDSALLHLQMRVISKTKSETSNMVVKKLEQAEKNSKAIERWIKDVTELHLSKPAPHVTYNVSMPDLDTLMEEWPEVMEDTLNNVGFPPSTLDCSLAQYITILCNLIDIPIADDNANSYFQALHMIFTLYSAVKSSQIFADRQKENASVQNSDINLSSIKTLN